MDNKNQKILLVYPTNFLEQKMGCDAYCFAIVKALKEFGFLVDFFSVKHSSCDYSDFEELNRSCGNLIDNFYCCERDFNEKYEYYYGTLCSDKIIDYFREIISKNHYDYVYIHYVGFLDLVRNSCLPYDTKVVHTMHDFDAVQRFYQKGEFEKIGQNIEDELKMLSYCDHIACISADEYQFFSRFFPNKKFHFLPHFMEFKNFSKSKKDIDCLFVGHSNPYNRDSIIWFVDHVYPHLKKGLNITICGKVNEMIKKKRPKYYKKMQDLGFNLIDFAQDLDALHERTKIVIVPMLEGTGLKIKTVSAMSYGLPIVATELGVDGFLDKTENGCLVSNDPQIFAKNINDLLTNKDLYAEFSRKIQDYFKKHFSVESGKQKLREIFQPKPKLKETGDKKFSIIVSIYNTEKYLPECIESIINQSYQNLEIILVNDGSPGNADEICRKYVQIDSRIKYIKQENQGVAIARNNGIAAASGDYIFCADSDDTLESRFIAKVNVVFEKQSCDCVVIGESFCEEPIELMGARPTWAFAVTRKFLEKYPDVRFQEHMQPCEDGLFTHKIMGLTDNIACCASAVYFYRQHSSSSEHQLTTKKILGDIPKWFEILEDFYTKYDLGDKKKLHLLAFIHNEPYKRFLEMRFSAAEHKHLFDLIHKFMEKHELNKPELAGRFPRDFQYFVTSDYISYRIKHGIVRFQKFIFSMRNQYKNGIKKKVITLFGINFKIRVKGVDR